MYNGALQKSDSKYNYKEVKQYNNGPYLVAADVSVVNTVSHRAQLSLDAVLIAASLHSPCPMSASP